MTISLKEPYNRPSKRDYMFDATSAASTSQLATFLPPKIDNDTILEARAKTREFHRRQRRGSHECRLPQRLAGILQRYRTSSNWVDHWSSNQYRARSRWIFLKVVSFGPTSSYIGGIRTDIPATRVAAPKATYQCAGAYLRSFDQLR